MKAEIILAKNLKTYRKKHKLTQRELADMTGLCIRSYSQIELCKSSARLATLNKLAAVTGLTVAQLLTDEGE